MQIIAEAVKASGTLVRLEPAEFAKLLASTHYPLVVYSEGGLIYTQHQYLMSYKGKAFFTKVVRINLSCLELLK